MLGDEETAAPPHGHAREPSELAGRRALAAKSAAERAVESENDDAMVLGVGNEELEAVHLARVGAGGASRRTTRRT